MKPKPLSLLPAVLSLFLIGFTQADEPERLKTLRLDFQVKLAERERKKGKCLGLIRCTRERAGVVSELVG